MLLPSRSSLPFSGPFDGRRESQMYLLSAQAREMIGEAVNALADPRRRQVWQRWSEQHSRLLLPDGPLCDDEPPMPAEVALVVLPALQEMEAVNRNRRASSKMSEDDISDLVNELTYIAALTRLVHQPSRPYKPIFPS